MSTAKVVLYSFWRSSCAWRVRLALNLKQIPYEIKSVNLPKGEQHDDEIKKINPMNRVPALLIDGHFLIESMNILYYLEETRKRIPLLPEDVYTRARVREICDIIVSGIQPLQNIAVLNHLNEEQRPEWSIYWINSGFTALEKLLSVSSRKYCIGDEITLADCCLVPQVSNACRFGVDLSPFPIITRINQELIKHDAFQAAHYSKQPDCPPEFAK